MFVQICRKDGDSHRKALDDLWTEGGEVISFRFFGGRNRTVGEFFNDNYDVTMLIFRAGDFENRVMRP